MTVQSLITLGAYSMMAFIYGAGAWSCAKGGRDICKLKKDVEELKKSLAATDEGVEYMSARVDCCCEHIRDVDRRVFNLLEANARNEANIAMIHDKYTELIDELADKFYFNVEDKPHKSEAISESECENEPTEEPVKKTKSSKNGEKTV